ncbi:MAG: helicase-exonuclease AddAB subunit AddB [Clostridium sp.]|uniref:helicase-exonuclease AddAB subunit AddB n=1 Tax=Clostridium sp. TaxID=1506 RepID=UPI002FC8A469
MGLKFIFGRSGRGKTTYCLNNIKKDLEENRGSKYILLVPEQLTFSSESKMLSIVNNDRDFKAEVLSFRTLGNRVFTEVGGLSHRHINSSGRSMLIYNVLSSLKGKLQIFTKSSIKTGIIPSISSIIKEFKRFDVESEIVEEASIKVESDTLKGKLKDISKILELFNDKLHHSYIDEEDEMELLSRKIEECTYLDDAIVYVDGFEGMNPIQLNVLEKILVKAKEVNITITGDIKGKGGSFDIFASSKEFEERLLKICEKLNISYNKPVDLNSIEEITRHSQSAELTHLEKYAFRFPFVPYKESTEDIEIFTASNLYSEVTAAASKIVSLVRDSGYRYRDIGVVARNMDTYEPLVRSIFEENNIPIYVDKKKEAMKNPIVVLLISALEVQKRRWSYEGVFTYLKSGLLDVSSEDINILENYVIENGIRGNRWKEPFTVYSNRRIEGEDSEEEKALLIRINEVRSKVITPLDNLHTTLKGAESARDMCRGLYEFLLLIGVDKKVTEIIDEFNTKGEILLAREYSQVFDILVEVLDQTVEILGDEKVTVSDFIDLISVGFSECTIGSVPSVIDSVLIAGVDRMRTQSSKVLMILGVNDGIFPAPIVDEGIISDIERAEIKEAGIKIDIDTREKSFNEQYLIYSTLTSASEKLILSHPIADHDGKTLRQSIILHRLKKVFPKIKTSSDLVDRLDSDIENIVTKAPTFNAMILKLRRYYEGGGIDPLWLDTYRWFINNGEKERIDNLLSGLHYTTQVKKVPKEKIKEIYNSSRLSVSQIETYSKCPFSYFVKYGLKGRERREFGFKSLEIGSFMHKVLEDFSDVIKKEGEDIRDVSKEWIEEVVAFIVDEMLEKIPDYVLNTSARYKYLSKRLKRLIVNAIDIISYHIKSGDFDAVGYEEGFGPNDKFPPIVIELEDGEKVELVGKIDRLDEADLNGEKYIRIVDYKSSKRKISLSDVYYGLQVQLLVYLDAILESYEKTSTPSAPGGMFYFKLDEPILTCESRVSEDEARDMMMKEFRMEGILLKDMNLALAMDHGLTSKSNIIPVAVKKDGEFTATTNAVTIDEFKTLRTYVKNLISGLCTKMLSGDISVMPYKDGEETPCQWCEYSSICQFDTSFKDNVYKITKTLNKDVAMDKIKGEVEVNE